MGEIRTAALDQRIEADLAVGRAAELVAELEQWEPGFDQRRCTGWALALSARQFR